MIRFILGGMLGFVPPSIAAEPVPGIGPFSIEKVATSGGVAEGPSCLPDGSIIFSDFKTAKLYHYSLDGRTSVFLEQTLNINGTMTSSSGRLYACEFADQAGALVYFDLKTKERHVVAGGFKGKPFNKMNDLVLDREGGVYFTDQVGREGMAQERPGVYYVEAGGRVKRLIDDLGNPNGVTLSLDERFLFVADSKEAKIVRYPIAEPGVLGAGEIFYWYGDNQPSDKAADGIAVDLDGNFYFAAFRGKELHIVNREGKRLGVIPFEDRVTNCEFGGLDGRTLFVTCGGSLYALRMAIPGHRFPGRIGY